VNESAVRTWVDGYLKAWGSNSAEDIGGLFTDDAVYRTEPYADPWVGRDAIVRGWIEAKDDPDDWEFELIRIDVAGDVAFVQARTDYTDETPRIYDNLWVIRLAEGGRCSDFTEWWMKRR
jgi:uncharacterized protein (TIGR02246 family)